MRVVAPILLALGAMWAMNRIMLWRVYAELSRVRHELAKQQVLKQESDAAYDAVIDGHNSLLDQLLKEIAGFEGGNILDLASQRERLTAIVTTMRPKSVSHYRKGIK